MAAPAPGPACEEVRGHDPLLPAARSCSALRFQFFLCFHLPLGLLPLPLPVSLLISPATARRKTMPLGLRAGQGSWAVRWTFRPWSARLHVSRRVGLQWTEAVPRLPGLAA